MNNPRLTDEEQRAIEANWDNVREAFRLLGLINAEFQSDPMSVQCFDLRVVQRVKECCDKRRQFVETHPLHGE